MLNKTNITSMFNMFDTNHDGNISVSELKQLFGNKAGFGGSSGDSEKLLKEIMNEVDKNHDNLISFEEFNDALTDLL